jgi:DNA invertase Pin-like site-specific DNA recombinase
MARKTLHKTGRECGKKGYPTATLKVLDCCGYSSDRLTWIKGAVIPLIGGIQMRIAIYARVSTDDKGQDPENQLRQLRQWCASSGHELVHEYIDRESGRKGTHGRKQFALLFEDAHKRKFDCVLFWSLDRFSREGMVPTIMHLQRLASYGIGFHSYTEAHLATDNELVRNILLALLASLAKVEAQKISERTRAGMARAKAQGKRIGRPSIPHKLREKIAKRIAAGETPYAVAKALGIDRHTAAKYA